MVCISTELKFQHFSPGLSSLLAEIRIADSHRAVDGFEATRKIKDIHPELPVIALTSYTSESDKKNASDIGFADFISKPYSRKILIDALNRILK